MHFAAPVWLLGLLPWTATLIFLLFRRTVSRSVPHLPFWQLKAGLSPRQSSIRRPPLAWLMLLAAAAVGLLAAAKPILGRDDAIPIIFAGSQEQLDSIFDRVMLAAADSDPQIYLSWQIPLNLKLPFNERSKATADTLQIDAGDSSLHSRLKIGSSIEIDSERSNGKPTHLTVSSMPAVEIVMAAVSARPRQMMVRLRNHHATGTAQLLIGTERAVEATIELPEIGQTSDAFIDLPDISPLMPIRMVAADEPLSELAVWHADWLPARVQAADVASAAVTRFCKAYADIHPAVDGSAVVLVSGNLPTDQPGLLTPVASESIERAKIVQQAHPVLAHTDLSLLEVLPMSLAVASPAGWQVIATANGRPMVAVRDSPARQVWLGFSAEAFEQREGFVVLLADAVDWIAQGSEVRGHLDLPEVKLPSVVEIQRALRAAVGVRREMTPWFAVVSAALVCVAALTRR